jgi:valyl-tRNA synthetase
VFDTWATSSMTPQIVGGWPGAGGDVPDGLYERVYPFSLRPQAHEIIRTWAFYTIVKSCYHFGEIPWKDVAISGWGIAGEGMGKISKSRGGGPVAPLAMIERYSADAVRYWAASTGPGKDAVISEEKIQVGTRLVTKLWNVARFSERFLAGYSPPPSRQPGASPDAELQPGFTTADRWILSRVQRLVRRATQLLDSYDYAAAKSEIENCFWSDFADNYLEMSKQRLYATAGPAREAARFTLYRLLLTTIQLLAPFMPYITEEIYQNLFAGKAPQDPGRAGSIHASPWPVPEESLEDTAAEQAGEALVAIATAVRRYKSERSLPLGTALARLQVEAGDPQLGKLLNAATSDLMSITRAQAVEVLERLDPAPDRLETDQGLRLVIARLAEV